MGDSPSAEKQLELAVQALGYARITLASVIGKWHRKTEGAALEYTIRQIDKAGTYLCGLQDIVDGGKVESTRQNRNP